MYTNVIYMSLHVIYANCLVEAVFWTNLSFVTKVYKTNSTLVEYYDSFLEFAHSTSFRYILLLTLLLLTMLLLFYFFTSWFQRHETNEKNKINTTNSYKMFDFEDLIVKIGSSVARTNWPSTWVFYFLFHLILYWFWLKE